MCDGRLLTPALFPSPSEARHAVAKDRNHNPPKTKKIPSPLRLTLAAFPLPYASRRPPPPGSFALRLTPTAASRILHPAPHAGCRPDPSPCASSWPPLLEPRRRMQITTTSLQQVWLRGSPRHRRVAFLGCASIHRGRCGCGDLDARCSSGGPASIMGDAAASVPIHRRCARSPVPYCRTTSCRRRRGAGTMTSRLICLC
jgi:hypothetical protein